MTRCHANTHHPSNKQTLGPPARPKNTQQQKTAHTVHTAQVSFHAKRASNFASPSMVMEGGRPRMMTSEWSFPRRGSEQYVLPSTKPRRRWGVVVLGVVSV